VTRIGILGSCTTRDVWRVAGLPSKHLTTVSRASCASLLAPRIDGVCLPPVLGALHPGGFEERCLRDDIAKTSLDRLERARPDILVVDFIDERADLLATRGSLVTASYAFEKGGLLAIEPFASARRIDRLSAEAWALWLAGLAALSQRIRHGPLAGARRVLHRSYLALGFRPGSADGVMAELVASPAARRQTLRKNRLLQSMYGAFLEAFPDTTTIDVPAATRLACAEHEWGPDPCHFVDDYYLACAAAMRAAGVDLAGGG
jgi:hypothetical protein